MSWSVSLTGVGPGLIPFLTLCLQLYETMLGSQNAHTAINILLAFLGTLGMAFIISLSLLFRLEGDSIKNYQGTVLNWLVETFFSFLPPSYSEPRFGGLADCWKSICRFPHDGPDIPLTAQQIFDWYYPLCVEAFALEGIEWTPACFIRSCRARWLKVEDNGSGVLHIRATCLQLTTNKFEHLDDPYQTYAQTLVARLKDKPARLKKAMDNLVKEHGWAGADLPPPPGWITLDEFFRRFRVRHEVFGADETFFSESAQYSAIMSVNASAYLAQWRISAVEAPAYVKEKLYKYLRRAGINLPTAFPKASDHGLHEAMELRVIKILSNITRNTNWMAMWIRNDKLALFHTQPVENYYQIMVGKDIRRFKMSPDIPKAPPVTTAQIIVCHEAAHNLTKLDIGAIFDRNPHLQYMFCSIVVPPEIKWRGDSLWPDIYGIRYLSDTVFEYIPEEDAGGSYVQDIENGLNLLEGETLITPLKSCIHMGPIYSRYAHHILVFSRPQLAPEVYCKFDVPELGVVPRNFMPLSDLRSRLVPLDVFESLRDYALSNDQPTWNDLYMKLRQLAATGIKASSPTMKYALSTYAYGISCVHAPPTGRLSGFMLTLSYLMRFPVVPFGWLWFTLSSVIVNQPPIYLNGFMKKHLVVSLTDKAYTFGNPNLCDLPIDLHYIPPDVGWGGYFWIHHARLARFFLIKFAATRLIDLLVWIYPQLDDIWGIISFRLSYHWFSPLLMIFSWIIASWWEVDLEDAYTSIKFLRRYVRRRVIYIGCMLWALLWGLPSNKLNLAVGYNPYYKFLILWVFYTVLFENLFYPIWSFPRLISEYYWLFLLTPFGPLLFWIMYHITPFKDHLPWHTDVEHNALLDRTMYRPTNYGSLDDSTDRTTSVSSSSSSSSSSDDPSRPVTPFQFGDWLNRRKRDIGISVSHVANFAKPIVEIITHDDEPRPIQQMQPVVVQPLPVNRPPDPDPGPLLPPPVPVPVLPPQQGVRALVMHALEPALFDTSELFAAVLRTFQIPLGINLPDPNRMCVWDSIARVLRVDSTLLWANYYATHNAGANELLGSVSYPDLANIFNYYRMQVTLWSATDIGGQFISRPDVPPVVYGQPVPDWPVVNMLLHEGPDPNVWHVTVGFPRLSAAGNAAVPVHPGFNSWIGKASRFVTLREMQWAVNYPIRMYVGLARMLAGAFRNPAFAGIANDPNIPPNLLGPDIQPVFPPVVNIPRIPLVAEDVVFDIGVNDILQARRLFSDYKKWPTNLNIVDSNGYVIASGFDAVLDHAQPKRVPARLFHGAPGTGKTTAFIREINQLLQQGVHPMNIKIWSHTEVLRDANQLRFMAAIPALRKDNFTWGGRIFTNVGTYLFLDDAGLAYPGTIPALCLVSSSLERIYVSFDAAQGTSVFPDASAVSRENEYTRKWLSNYSTQYATDVHRMSAEICELFGLPVPIQPSHGAVIMCSNAPPSFANVPDVPLFVASPKYAEAKNNGGTKTYEFSKVQGLEFDHDTTVDCGGLTDGSSDTSIWTSCTRGKGNLWLLYRPVANNSTIQPLSYGTSGILSSIFSMIALNQKPVLLPQDDPNRLVARAVQSHLASSLSPACCALLGLQATMPVLAGFSYARDHNENFSRQQAQPMVDLTTPRTFKKGNPKGKFVERGAMWVERPFKGRRDNVKWALRHHIPMPNSVSISADPPKYVPPPLRFPKGAPDKDTFFEPKPRAYEEEITVPGSIYLTKARIPDGPLAAQHQSRSDHALVQKSLMARTPPRRDDPKLSRSDIKRLRQLQHGYTKFFDKHPVMDLDMDLFEVASDKAIESWLSGRTMEQVINAVDKWQPDHPHDHVSLFLKSQMDKKLGNRGSDIHKGQIITEVPLSKTMVDAVWATYAEMVLRKHAKPGTLLFSKMNPGQLRDWFEKNWTPNVGCTANDYTGWDTGMDRVFLAFDKWLFKRIGIPDWYIDRYHEFRVNSNSFLGAYPIMQASGDRWTWLMNSVRNAALTGASIDCPPGTSAAFCGDDSVVERFWKKMVGFDVSKWPVLPKPVSGYRVPFCAYEIGGPTISISAEAVDYRLTIAIQNGEKRQDYYNSIFDQIREVLDVSPSNKFLYSVRDKLKAASYLMGLHIDVEGHTVAV